MQNSRSDKNRIRFFQFLVAVGLTFAMASQAGAGTTAYRKIVLGDNPLVYYEFDETAGTTALNSADSGATYDGMITAVEGVLTGVTLGQTSFANGGSGAYDFGGGRVTFGATLGAMTEWSVEAWMKYDQVGLGNSHIVGNDLGGWNDDVIIGMGPEQGLGGNGGGQFGVVQQGAPGTVRDGAGAAMSADEWHHVVVTGSTTAGELIVYIDGEVVDTNDSLTNGVIFGDNAFVLGAKRAAGGQEYNGLLDEVAIYNTALTPTQVSNHFNLIGGPAAPFAITEIDYTPDAEPNPTVTLTWRKSGALSYIAKVSTDLGDWMTDIGDSLTANLDENPEDADHITMTLPLPPGPDYVGEAFFRIEEE